MSRTAYFTASVLLIAQAAFAEGPETLPIGSKAIDFSLPGVDGKTYSLKDFASSKLLVLIFTCNHCPTAQAYEDRIKQFVVDYASKGVAIVAISPNDPLSVRLDEMGYTDVGDSFDDMKIRAKDKQFNFPYLYDGETSALSMKYGPQATPHVFIFDHDRISNTPAASTTVKNQEQPKHTTHAPRLMHSSLEARYRSRKPKHSVVPSSGPKKRGTWSLRRTNGPKKK